MVHTDARTSRQAESSIRVAEGERVGVLFSSDASPEMPAALGRKMVECVDDAVRRRGWPLEILKQEEVYAALFPGLTPKQVLIRPNTLPLLVARAEIRERIERLHLRYLVLVGGYTDGGADGGVVPFAGWVWSRQRVDLAASVFELGRGTRAGSVQSGAAGSQFVVALMGVVPIGGGVDATGSACGPLGAEVVRMIGAPGD